MRQTPLERAARQHAQRVPPVRGGAAHVVDRARRRRRRARGTPSRARASGAATRPGDGPGRAERGAQLVALAVDARARASTTAITIALRGPTFMNVCRAPLGAHADGDDQLVVGAARSLRPDEELGERQRARRRARSRARPRASATSSGGSASPAGDAVPRLPPIVPRLRICGEPTVRDASASAGSARQPGRPSPRCTSAPAPSRSVPFSRDQPVELARPRSG